MADERGAPDYSHWDYAKEARDNKEYFKKIGAADRLAGKEPNHCLYYAWYPGSACAVGYRQGYGETI